MTPLDGAKFLERSSIDAVRSCIASARALSGVSPGVNA